MKELKNYLPFDFPTNYSLENSESWRWDRKDALYIPRSKVEVGQLIYSNPDFIVYFPSPDFSAFAPLKDAPFAQLNLNLSTEFFYSFVRENQEIEEPVMIKLESEGEKMHLCKVFAGLKNNSKTQVWLDLSTADKVWQNFLLQVEIWENSQLDLVIWLGNKDKSQTVQTLFIHALLGKNSQVRINAIAQSPSFVRVDAVAQLNGENASFNFGGIQKGTKEANLDFHIQALHKAPNCQSNQLIRGVLDENSLGIYSGLIYVKEGSQQTEAQQNSRYLLLSENSQAQAMPQLEIYADEVKCNHGATVGKISEESLFYLQSRGISKTEAQKILISAFNKEAIVVEGKLKNMLEEALDKE